MANAERICKTENDMTGENVFDVSRPNILSNPFTHIKDRTTLAKYVVKDRDTAINLYEKYFDKMMEKTDSDFKMEFDRIYEAFLKYDTIYLKCYCKLDQRCHSDIIIKKLNQRLLKDKLEKIKLSKIVGGEKFQDLKKALKIIVDERNEQNT